MDVASLQISLIIQVCLNPELELKSIGINTSDFFWVQINASGITGFERCNLMNM